MIELIKRLIYKTIGAANFIRRIEWRKMLEYLDPNGGERILDIACGDGILSLKIAEKGCEVHGIDISENLIETASSFANQESIACEFIVGDAENLPYPDGYFDKIVCSCSLEHFNDDIKALKEMNRVLKPGGRVVMTVDSLTYPISDELKQKHRKRYNVVNYYTREKLKERFEIAGIKMNRSEYILNSLITSFFFNYIFIKANLPQFLQTVISLIAHPLCLVSDKLFGAEDIGYTLIAEGEKTHDY